MKDINKSNKRRAKFLIFIGASFFMYAILYFPKENEIIELNDILAKIIMSIIIAFLSTYGGIWFTEFIDRNWIKKK